MSAYDGCTCGKNAPCECGHCSCEHRESPNPAHLGAVYCIECDCPDYNGATFCEQCGECFAPFRDEDYNAEEFCSAECYRTAAYQAEQRSTASMIEMQRAESRRRFALAGIGLGKDDKAGGAVFDAMVFAAIFALAWVGVALAFSF